MIFETIQNQLEANQFTIVSKDQHRPWGGFFCYCGGASARVFQSVFLIDSIYKV
jgi:hypothetical protein